MNKLLDFYCCLLIQINIKASKWLDEQAQKEGWTKAEKLKNRQTSQGTLVFVNDKETHRASLVEVWIFFFLS